MTFRTRDLNQEPHVVYRIYDAHDNLLYVGVSVNFEARFRDHKNRAEWGPDYARHELTWFPNRPEAESAEVAAIMDERPKYNVAATVRLPRPEKPIRFTLDLDPARHLALRQFVATSGAGGRASDVLRALLDELDEDPDLAARVRARIWAGKR
jgi:predicted GIY-YIG superfamily endonuclease